ncbi:MAG: glycosyltransferase family 2 protein [Bacteroidetes bacterium]|nr:glycosyltransferase family 2 protein [Bacteroidota bacterium]
MPSISAVIIAKNEEGKIRLCLDSLKSFAAEIVVVDSGSSDRTAELCLEQGCRVFHREFDSYGSQKQFAVGQAVNDWVLSVDADEVLTAELQKELAGMTMAGELPFDTYTIPFSLVYMGRILKHSGVGHEVHLRLFNRKKGRFTTSAVHEGIVCDGSTGKLKNRILHYSYRDISHHLEKINIYTSQAAEELVKKGKRYSHFAIVFKFPLSFITYYILKGGILDGYPGFVWSYLAAFYATIKLAKTTERQKIQ